MRLTLRGKWMPGVGSQWILRLPDETTSRAWFAGKNNVLVTVSSVSTYSGANSIRAVACVRRDGRILGHIYDDEIEWLTPVSPKQSY